MLNGKKIVQVKIVYINWIYILPKKKKSNFSKIYHIRACFMSHLDYQEEKWKYVVRN